MGQWAEGEWERLARQAQNVAERQRMDIKRLEIALNRILLADNLQTAKRVAKSVFAVNKKLREKRNPR